MHTQHVTIASATGKEADVQLWRPGLAPGCLGVYPLTFIGLCWLYFQELLRHYGGIGKFVQLLDYGAEAECTHRALLALRILTDKEVDRLTILKSGGVRPLVRLLDSGPESEVGCHNVHCALVYWVGSYFLLLEKV